MSEKFILLLLLYYVDGISRRTRKTAGPRDIYTHATIIMIIMIIIHALRVVSTRSTPDKSTDRRRTRRIKI